MVKFDDFKLELIYFNKSRKLITATVTLLNDTILQPLELVRWLEVWLDRKLSFKSYVQKRIAMATTAMYLTMRLLNTE